MSEKAFRELLLEAVDSTLSSLGESVKQSVYFHLEKKFDIPKDEIPSRVGDFDKGLEKIFGVGAQFLEVLIMKKLYEEVGAKGKILKVGQGQEFNFVDYVNAIELTYFRSKER